MITEQQILEASGAELSRLAGEVLGNGKHELTGFFPEFYCSKCHKFKPRQSDYEERCICLIPLTWDSAMQWRDWAVREYGWEMFCDSIALVSFDMDTHKELLYGMAEIIIHSSKPEHYIMAACLCKIRSKK